MSKLIEFTKIEATGNDFIVIDSGKFPVNLFPAERIEKMCDRHFGIGADGLIFIEKGRETAFEMRYYNSDGLPATMCANGARAAVLFAAVAGIIGCKEDFIFSALDGGHHAKIYAIDDIEIEILYQTGQKKINFSSLGLEEEMYVEGFANTGVPHLVISTAGDLDAIDINTVGRRLRFDPLFGREGTNVNFVKTLSANEIAIRSYERGIEGETLSCGTGVAAAALLYMKNADTSQQKVTVNTKGGRLIVGFSEGRLMLRGPANIVYVGNLHSD